ARKKTVAKMLARALTTVAMQQQQQHLSRVSCLSPDLASSAATTAARIGRSGSLDDHLAATDELKNYNQEDDDEDNPDEEGEEAGALKQEEDEDGAASAPSHDDLLRNRLRSSEPSNLRRDKSELVAEAESAAAAAAAAEALWRPFELVHQPLQSAAAASRSVANYGRGAQLPPQSAAQAMLNESNSQSSSSRSAARRALQQQPQQQPKQRIKKPLNAFMLYMRDHRAAVAAEHSLRESAEINRLLGRQWQSLSRQEQAKYYHLAQLEKERHCRLHPNWSAKDNYGCGAGVSGATSSSVGASYRRQQQQQQRSNQLNLNRSILIDLDNCSNKKCRAVYGVQRQDLWCRPCRRKKRCARFGGDNKPSGVSVAMETVAV
ncbi:hypothetical protein BOX15_Mlig033143g1, partial [Macrostomum lignano]